jgi:ubiquinone/menaquinone biosynthesis C-methylase UbiE
LAEASDRAAGPGAGERYTFGDEAAVRRAFQQRTLVDCASFLLPHLRPGMSVLDCGCGPGSLTVDLAARVAPGEVVGVDREAGQFAQARALAAERGVTNVRFEEADA